MLRAVAAAAALCAGASGAKPNVVFILTDDQDVTLDASTHMPKLDKYLKRGGATLTNQFVATPVCCPSRGSYHTGRHIHNIPMTDNTIAGNCSGPEWNAGAEKETSGVWMQGLGYRTAYFGKYLNDYGSAPAGGVAHVPPGWDHWYGLVGNSVYYNYTISNDGVAEHHGDDYEADYLTDVLTRQAVKFMKAGDGRPFFAIVGPPSCHGPHEPAPQYAHTLTEKPFAKAVRSPNYGNSWEDKHWVVRYQGAQWAAETENREKFTDWEHVRRLETLLSVDDMIEAFVETLTDLGELDNTFIFYSSDHGYHLGQFGMLKDKRMPYEEDIRVPGFVRGPGIPAGSVSSAVVVSIDMLPTFIDIGGGEVPGSMDGRSYLADLQRPSGAAAERSFLVEYHGETNAPGGVCRGPGQWAPGMACWVEGGELLAPGPFEGEPLCSCQDAKNNTYACMRTLSAAEDTMYCEFEEDGTFVEHYDLTVDAWQRKNTARELAPEAAARFRARLAELKACKGAGCVHTGGSLRAP